MNSFLDRLMDFMRHCGINYNQITVAAGLSNGLIGKAKSNAKGLTSTNIEKILLAYPELSAEWLLTGKGDMLKNTIPYNNSNRSTVNAFHVTKQTPGAIPLVLEKVAGGFANEHFDIKEKDVLAYYVIPKFRSLGVDFMIEVVGDSMIPRYWPGDIIACSIIYNSRFIQWNKCHLLATYEQGLILKRIMPGSDDTCLKAVSENGEYPPFEIPKEEINGIARVVGVIHLD